MSYKEIIQWMFEQLPMYQRIGKQAYKADLSNTILLAKHLDHPERGFKSIHVGGTNGKGSTSHILASVLMESGYKVGLYTSPHLKDFRERIKVNGHMIEKSYVTEFITTHKSFFEKNQLSFFEMTVGLAFSYFRDQNVDLAVIEVGLGGRLDSTNIILPELSVITNIGYDHMQFLGNTLQKIAEEKAGIIKQGVPVVIGEVLKETRPVFIARAHQQDAKIIFAEEQLHPKEFSSDLKGYYQRKNIQTTYVALKQLQKTYKAISEDSIAKGFSKVVENTGLMGRWQTLAEEPLIIADTAHNKEGIKEVAEQLKHQNYERLFLVLGFVKDKAVEELLILYPGDAEFFFCTPEVSRGLPTEELVEIAAKTGITGTPFKTVSDAFNAAKNKASDKDLIFVGGSTFVVAEVV